MKAWRLHAYGGPEALRCDEVPVPAAGNGELLVRVAAASLNPIDWKIREGRLKGVFPMQFPKVLGRDCAGEVVESGTADFAAGDRVVAVADPARDGTHAEFTVVLARLAARIPDGIGEGDAVALGIAGVSALIPLAEVAELKPGMRVLIHAGAGGVGTTAVQLARHFGAEVLATCGPANLDYVKSLGADIAIDYSREDFVRAAGPCDVVLDTQGGDVHRRSFGALKAGGLLVYLSAAPVDPVPPRQDVRVVQAQIRATSERLASLLGLAAQGAIRPQVGRTFRFEDAQSAYAACQSGHGRGKIVLEVGARPV